MSQKSVLVVDDQAMFRDAVAFEMEYLGFKATLAEDGQDAYKKIQAEAFSLVISDIRMPNWDGARLLQELRKSSAAEPPFILMTGFADLRMQDAYEMGADAFLGKPLNPDQLKDVITHLLLPPDAQLNDGGQEPAQLQLPQPVVLELGRRGFFMSGTIDYRKVKPGTIVSFDFQTNILAAGSLTGSGIIRWTRERGDDDTHAGVGVEIMKLTAPQPTEFLKFVKAQGLVAAIAKGTKAKA